MGEEGEPRLWAAALGESVAPLYPVSSSHNVRTVSNLRLVSSVGHAALVI